MRRTVKGILNQVADYFEADSTDFPVEDMTVYQEQREAIETLQAKVEQYEQTMAEVLGVSRLEVKFAIESPDPVAAFGQLLGLHRFSGDSDLAAPDV